MIQPARVRPLNDHPVRSEQPYVLYWMQQSARTRSNHALAAAIDLANSLGKPLVVCFGLMDDYPSANARHYAHLLEGLRDVASALETIGVKYVVRHGQPFDAAIHYGQHACAVFCDRGYLRHQNQWRDRVADGVACQVIEVETDVVVPVETASNKHEFAARTIRPKIHRLWDAYLVPLNDRRPKVSAAKLKLSGPTIDVSDPVAALKKLKVDRSVSPVNDYPGGERAAQRRLDAFITERLSGYADKRNEPADSWTSRLSMSLHFGHLSPLEIALRVKAAKVPQADRDAYLEELIVRRELSMNFCHFVPDYDRYDCLPAWAKQTLDQHRDDPRDALYTTKQLEDAETNDIYWNAAQLEMTLTGFMVNYMRMYWGKRILGWMKTPEEAFATTMKLNDKYFLCGRDPNGYANVAWVFGLHDRPWARRKVFGTVRYMNAGGLERKFDIDRYVAKIDALARERIGRGVRR